VGNTPLDSDVMATYGYLIDQLNRFDLAYLHFVEGATGMGREVPEGISLEQLRARFKGPYIANPDLVERFKTGAALAEAPPETWYGGGAHGYTDWPVLGASAS
jgi:N-ethylmaleimide reductase